jgi:hypothetical protein
MKSKQELDDLKANWEEDPNWDIENTEGFEEHKEELLAYRLMRQKMWEDEARVRIKQYAELFKCSEGLVCKLMALETRVQALEERLYYTPK